MRKKRTEAKQTEVMQISEGELRRLTADLDEIHHATLPAMQEAVRAWADDVAAEGRRLADTPTGRRRFLAGGGAVLGGLVVAACSSSNKSSSGNTGGVAATTSTVAGQLTGDFLVAALAASLENLAVQTYQAGLDAATAGKLGPVPPAVATFATTVKGQHADHAAAWNSILTNSGREAVTGVDQTVRSGVVDPGFAAVKDVTGLARFALSLEQVASATYLDSIAKIQNSNALKTAASIQPVEMQHAAVLHFVLGEYPVPDSFATTDGARPPTDTIG